MTPEDLHTGFGEMVLQKRIQNWWEENPMRYDWRKTNPYQEGTLEWFKEIDRRFFSSSASFFAQVKGEKPFARLIPFELLKGKRVLEIGCGSGVHTQLLAQAGCEVTAIDLTTKAVETTRTRLRLLGLDAKVFQMDAESLDSPEEQFDFIWSWGVIHHSARTEKIVAEMWRVLKPEGEARVMVYHLHSLNVLGAIIRGILTLRYPKMSLAELLNYYSDGLLAKYYSQKQLALLFQQFSVEIQVFGQKTDLIPLPGIHFGNTLKRWLTEMTPNEIARPLLARVGGFLFATARKYSSSKS